MGREDPFLRGFEEKLAGFLANVGQRVAASAPAQWYQRTKASPMYGVKKLVGGTIVGGAALGYGVHKATVDPEQAQYKVAPGVM